MKIEGWIVYLLLINLITCVVYGIDKQKAKRGRWRISEKTLITLAVVGGSIGAYIGMKVFRHKTKHAKFVWGIPIIFCIQLSLFLGCIYIGIL